ncbi:TetR family transcriptional regulator [Ralstonia solanacearum]|uniref:TetR family transcriptional regulator n=1 Tax=Ralstonia solanacearum TaxID=305 RepID=UPI003DA66F9F
MARQTRAGAAQTRARVIEAATEVFSERGLRAATPEEVAPRAGVTRGAVYGHFSGKPLLVAAIIDGLRWPLDVGEDLADYPSHPRPLRQLHVQLSAQMARCQQTPPQWQAVMLVLRESGYAAWPKASSDHALHLQENAVARLGDVMRLARQRHQLRLDIEPDAAARCLHAVGIGILLGHAGKRVRGMRIDIPQCLRLFFEGIENTAEGPSDTPERHSRLALDGARHRAPRA